MTPALPSPSPSPFPDPLSLCLPQHLPFALRLYTAESIPAHHLTTCFKLIESTSAAAYAASSKGWSPRAKMREMRDPDMRYLLVVHRRCPSAKNVTASMEDGAGDKPPNAEGEMDTDSDDSDLGEVAGFISYMFTTEDTTPVVYIYEIHLSSSTRNLGVGASLLSAVEQIGASSGHKMAMLTVFVSNADAIRLYKRLGYSKWDEEYIATKRRKLRSGTKESKPSYIIMAKDLPQASKDEINSTAGVN